MPNEEHLIKIFEYALNQEETGKSFFRGYRDKFSEIYSKMPWGG
jgi:hypothetical protein